jgi:hypothetical protein
MARFSVPRTPSCVLESTGRDIHVLAGHVENLNGGGGLSKAEMQKLYDAGYRDGMRAVEDKQYGSVDFYNADGTPEWIEIALFCQRSSSRLREMRSSS